MNGEPILRPPQEEDVFRRVWDRVMAGRSVQDSPVEPAPKPTYPETDPQTYSSGCPSPRWKDGDLSCGYLTALRQAPPEPPMTDRPVSDLPQAGMDEGDREPAAHLRRQTLEALEGWQFYRHLARRTRGNAARTLSALASDQHKLARKLSAAYFLCSGVRYWPADRLSVPAITSYWGALRQRYQAEQQAELNYRMATDNAGEETLAALYGELSESCRAHCRQLRTLLEQSCP